MKWSILKMEESGFGIIKAYCRTAFILAALINLVLSGIGLSQEKGIVLLALKDKNTNRFKTIMKL